MEDKAGVRWHRRLWVEGHEGYGFDVGMLVNGSHGLGNGKHHDGKSMTEQDTHGIISMVELYWLLGFGVKALCLGMESRTLNLEITVS